MGPARRGFTLIELLMALAVFAVVALALTRMLVMTQRVTTAQRIRTTLQFDLRTGARVVPNELAMLNQSDSTDIASISDTAIAYRAMRGFFVLCAEVGSRRTVQVINARPSGLTLAYRPPAAGDSALLYYEADTLKLSDDRWVPVAIAGVATSSCTFGGRTYAAHALTLGGAGIAGDLPLGDFSVGAPVRSYERARLALYTSGGQKWLGMCTGPPTCSLEPVFGPLARTNGVTITGVNDLGLLVTGTSFADRNSLGSLRIRFIGVGEQAVSRGGEGRIPIADTLSTVVLLRAIARP